VVVRGGLLAVLLDDQWRVWVRCLTRSFEVATAATHLLILLEVGQLSSSYPCFLRCTALSFAGLKLQSEAADILPRGSCRQQVCGWALLLLLLLVLCCCCYMWCWQWQRHYCWLLLLLLLLLL
jgi:hypothetical protein